MTALRRREVARARALGLRVVAQAVYIHNNDITGFGKMLKHAFVGLAIFGFSGPAWSDAVERSMRPQIRPAMSQPAQAALAVLLPEAGVAPRASLRPATRPLIVAATAAVASAAQQAGFQDWIARFRTRALQAGINEQVFDLAFRETTYDPDVIRRDRNQSEFNKTIWDYLDSAASESRIANGRDALLVHAATLDRIEAAYGVEKEVVTAIWGLESAYGAHRGTKPVIPALATLAHDGRRGAFFESQLIAALKILQRGDTTAQNMTGSWAGAMGHTQFIPTSYQALAVDFTGDGRRDIWADDPTDALASTANYLAKNGWRKGMPWGVEVRLPAGFDYTLAGKSTRKLPSEWARLGVTDIAGQRVTDHSKARVLLPAGAQGAAFLVFDNFDVIARYNAADAYVIGVGHLSDRLRGAGPIVADWPRGDRALSRDERMDLQRLLTARGFSTGGVDGRIGPRSTAALRAFQRSVGMVPDGYASLTVLQRLR